ncbi:MAG: hypothetical protein COA79_00270 [Planctomycetota bacterium]|nr:MAG: hypothetical protein COA79_00270 [Planctomycetota bacterium]
MRVNIFSKYLFYSVGGAEKSMQQYLNKNYDINDEVVLYGAINIKNFNSDKYKHNFPDYYKLVNVLFPFLLSRFPYVEYCLNRNSIKSYFSKIESSEELLTYGIYAPLAIIGYKGKSVFFLRSETDLCINNNYHIGFKKVLNSIYKLIESPFFSFYKKDIYKAVQISNVICNSKWMQDQLLKRFEKISKIEYPEINLVELKEGFKLLPKEKRGVVFIGDNIFKGSHLLPKIANLLPSITFFIFDRRMNKLKINKNMHYMAWESDPKKVYQYADLVIVPSIWLEAFGRVSIEAQALNIPVLVSNRGGLPETIDHDSKYIIDDYKNPVEWAKRIENILAHD